jgi:hypothetical protein
MKKLILTLFAVVALSVTASAQIKQIKSTQLPAQARTTIRNAWNGAPIVDTWRNKQGRKVEYKASVEDGSTIKFDASGRWIEMKSYGGVPTKMLPQALLNHINKYYEGEQIVWVTKTPKRYQVQLIDGSKLEFNAKGVFQAFL